MPIGSVTRGTTATNRLRRVARWITQLPPFRSEPAPLVVDFGFGPSATTTLELHQRLSRLRPAVEIVVMELDPERVTRSTVLARPGVALRLGGFEVPLGGFQVPLGGRSAVAWRTSSAPSTCCASATSRGFSSSRGR